MLKERVTVTVDADILALVRKAAGEGSVSSVVERALREMLNRQRNAHEHLKQRIAQIEQRDPQGAAEARRQAKELVETTFGEEK